MLSYKFKEFNQFWQLSGQYFHSTSSVQLLYVKVQSVQKSNHFRSIFFVILTIETHKDIYVNRIEKKGNLFCQFFGSKGKIIRRKHLIKLPRFYWEREDGRRTIGLNCSTYYYVSMILLIVTNFSMISGHHIYLFSFTSVI